MKKTTKNPHYHPENDSEAEISQGEFPHLSPEEILAQTQAIEEAKAEKKRLREHRRRIKELKALQQKKSRRVAPILLIITFLICLGLMIFTSQFNKY